LKRSNRLVLLVGVFLAIVAFIGILLLMQGGDDGNNQGSGPPTTVNVVVATNDIPLGTRVQAGDVEVQVKETTAAEPGYFSDTSQVIGKVVRQPVTAGQQVTSATFGAGGTITDITCPALRVCMAVQVDQVSGVGTLIKTGDYVDMVVGFTGDKFPVITLNAQDDTFTVVSGINSTSVKALLQGMQVVGTLLPPPPAEDPNAPPDDGTGDGTTLTGQQQIVILAVTTQQAEVIKFAQLDGSISLTLRSPDDFVDPTTGDPLPAVVPVETTGIILKTLVDTYGVLPPELVETVLPEQDTDETPAP
jgi:Flp pilus assembly protein CpaB